jgi:hypothetical protein
VGENRREEQPGNLAESRWGIWTNEPGPGSQVTQLLAFLVGQTSPTDPAGQGESGKRQC